MSCNKCGKTDAVTQKDLSAFIQRGGCGPLSAMIPAVANNGRFEDGVRVTGASIGLQGSRSPVYRLNSDKKRAISAYIDEPVEAGTIDLEWSRVGCGGLSTAELSSQPMDIVVGEFCNGESRYDAGNASSLLRFCGVHSPNISYSDLASFDANDDSQITIPQSAQITDAYRTIDQHLSHIVIEADDPIERHHDIVYLPDSDGSGPGCGEVWYAVRNGSSPTITYRTPQTGIQSTPEIPFYNSSVALYAASLAVYKNRLMLHRKSDGIWSIPIGELYEPMVLNSIFSENSFWGNSFVGCGNNLYLVGGYTATTPRVLKVDQFGQSEVVYNASSPSDPVLYCGTCCDGNIVVAGQYGSIYESSGCDTLTPWGNDSPTDHPIFAIASRVPGEIWYGDYDSPNNEGKVYWTDSRNRKSYVALSGLGQVLSIKWSTACVGYIVSADLQDNINTIYRTVDGGSSWGTVSKIPRGQGQNNPLTVPTCRYSYELANQFLTFTSLGIYEAISC